MGSENNYTHHDQQEVMTQAGISGGMTTNPRSGAAALVCSITSLLSRNTEL